MFTTMVTMISFHGLISCWQLFHEFLTSNAVGLYGCFMLLIKVHVNWLGLLIMFIAVVIRSGFCVIIEPLI